MIESTNDKLTVVSSEYMVYSEKDYDENYDIIFNKNDNETELILPDDFNQKINPNLLLLYSFFYLWGITFINF